MSRGLIAAIAVAVALVLGTLVVLASGSDHNDLPRSSQPTTSTTPVTEPTPSVGGDPTSDRLGRKVVIPSHPAGQPLAQREPEPRTECRGGAVTSPGGMQIQRSYGMPILVSSTDGPARVEGAALVGYRRSPQGAALAAWNFIARVYAGGTPGREALAKLAVLSDADRARLTQAPESNPPTEPDKFRIRFAAPDQFRVLSCDNEFAAVELALPLDTAGDRTWAGVRLNMLWRDGDWKVQTALSPDSIGGGQKYTSLEGWTPWAL